MAKKSRNAHEGQMRVWISVEAHQYLKKLAMRSMRTVGAQLDLIVKQVFARVKAKDKAERNRRKGG